jgi:phosphoribosylamine--glycine ligase
LKLLVIGSGGREHALAWKLAQSPRVQKVYVAPGNGGTASEAGVENLPLGAMAELVDFARQEQVHLTVVGPEAPLAAGVVDAFREAGLRIFGPTRAAAQLESSKDFAKRFMVRHRIPTARHATFERAREAKAYVEKEGAPIVVKADGWPPARAWWWPQAWPGACGDRHDARQNQLGTAGACSDRGMCRARGASS